MRSFFIDKEPGEKEKYHVDVKIVIYRAMLGKYPDFLSHCETERNAREGYPTKFCYCTEHTMLDKNDAERIADELEEKYAETLSECEKSGDWTNSPYDFSKMDLLWSK